MDINLIRQDTKGCHDKIFLNSAGCSLPPKVILEKMFAYFEQEEQLGGYAVEAMRAKELAQFYDEAAKLVNCQPHNIAFTYSASDAYTKALSSIPFTEGGTILTTDDDYISNQIGFFSLQKRFNLNILRSNNLENGLIDLEDFEEKVRKHKPTLVAITHIPTNSGLVQQAEDVGAICKKYNVWYLLDSCQSVGQMPVDVEKIGCDFLNATGRKFLRGPRLTGFLYVSDKALEAGLEPLYIDRRGADWTSFDDYTVKKDAKRFESMEINAGVIGLKEAIAYANNIGLDKIYDYNIELIKRLRANLSQHPSVQILDKGDTLCSLFTFYMHGKNLEDMVSVLKSKDVVFSTSLKHFALIDFTKKGVDWAIRFAPHYFNTMVEIDNVSDIVASMK